MAAITDKFSKTSNGGVPVVAHVNSPRATGVTTLSLDAATNWPTDTGIKFSTYKVNTAGTKVVGSQRDWKGTLAGSTISNMTLTDGIDNLGNATGDVVVMMITAAWGEDLIEGITTFANQDGTLKGSAIRSALNETSTTGAGWSALGSAPTTVTYNGNRSYDLVFNGVDYTPTVSNGMRLKTTRTVAAPTQCASLNGTNQYFNRATTINGMTFTNNFVAGAWVKLSSYAVGTIISRYGGASGWELAMTADGRINLVGYNGSGSNTRYIQSYQSLPLNKWVHITAQLDMSAFTNTATTCYVMFDGADVPGEMKQGGTNPTSLVQSGNLEVGSRAASNFFNGKIAQAFVTSAKLTQTQVRAIYSQGLTAADVATYSIASAFSLSGAAGLTDINTTSANNLTANGSATTTTTDAPFTQDDTGVPSGTTDFAIETNKAFSGGNTTITVQVPEGCAIPTSGGVATVSYSSNKVPFAFPSDRGRWEVSYLLIAMSTNNPAAAFTAYNWQSARLTVPVGGWSLRYEGNIWVDKATNASGVGSSWLGLTPANVSRIGRLSASTYTAAAGSTDVAMVTRHAAEDKVAFSAATTVYANLIGEGTTHLEWFASTNTFAGQALVIVAEPGAL